MPKTISGRSCTARAMLIGVVALKLENRRLGTSSSFAELQSVAARANRQLLQSIHVRPSTLSSVKRGKSQHRLGDFTLTSLENCVIQL